MNTASGLRKARWVACILILLLAGCAGEDAGPGYPGDAVFTTSVDDPPGDFNRAFDGPPVPIPFPSVDLKQVRLGVDDTYVYLRFDFYGPIPESVQTVAGDRVYRQNASVNLDSDDNPATGGDGGGIEIFFALLITYGKDVLVYANYDIVAGDIHQNRGHRSGDMVDGGPGHDFIVIRVDHKGLEQWFPRGRTVPVHCWSEAMSDGYHHFASDNLRSFRWTIP